MPAEPSGLVARCIRSSLAHPWLVVLLALMLTIAGLFGLRTAPLDALPDIGDLQVIVRTSYPGQAPGIVEDQVTFPLSAALRAVPHATTVRGYSFFGDSYVYVLFADGTDADLARSRVQEALTRIAPQLPGEAHPALGPDATGVGWIYEYALIDRSGRHDLAQLRALQDWTLRYQLQSVPGVAEVAAIGGMVKEYQIILDPLKLRAYGMTLAQIRAALEAGNRESGGSVIELAETEYMVRASGYVHSLEDLRHIPLSSNAHGVPVMLQDVADIRLGPEIRRGIADLDGKGEVAGGVVVMRSDANARATLAALKQRLAEVAGSLPPGVEIVTTYDRSQLIDAATRNLLWKLAWELGAVFVACLIFLLDVPSALVVVAVLPLGVLAALLVMNVRGMSANIMSLGGIAIAVGAMVDAAIVMMENVHKALERAEHPETSRPRLIAQACVQVGPALFFSLLLIALSFLPVLTLEAQEGRLFAPLAYTKTLTMIAAALLSVTLVPVLIVLCVRRVRGEQENPVNRLAVSAYRPLLDFSLRHPALVVVGAVALTLVSLWPLLRVGTEFLPDMNEGDLLYMPVTLPGISADAARALLQTTDRRIASLPEVEHAFGKAGRAESATDPAPLEMLETVVKLKPRSEWRAGVGPAELAAQLAERVRLPGVTNSWRPPIKARIEMLSTGIRTPLAIRISGPDLRQIAAIATRIEQALRGLPEVDSIYAERTEGGHYVDVEIDRAAAARFGLSVDDIHEVIRLAVGGQVVSQSVEGRERFPISIRYAQQWRNSLEQLRSLPIVTGRGAQITLGDVARVGFESGPVVIRSEDARLAGWVYITPRSGDAAAVVRAARQKLASAHVLPPGYSLTWAGDYQHMQRAFARLGWVIPVALAVIALLLYAALRAWRDVLLILVPLPTALTGGAWLLWFLHYRLSVASAVGFIALGGVAAETGVIMLVYLNQSWNEKRRQTGAVTAADLREAIMEGALLRLRPKLMTVTAILAGLMPLMLGEGAGAEMMKRIAAPMLGGMVTATVLTLLLVPALFLMVRSRTDLGGSGGSLVGNSDIL